MTEPELVEAEYRHNWEFIDRVPTKEDVIGLLKTLPNWWGVEPHRYWEFIQALPQAKRVVPDPTKPKMGVEYKTSFSLYFSVAGRIAMMNRAAELNNWRVDFEPELVTPTGIPGFVMTGDRFVYREYCCVYTLEDGKPVLLGRRPGQAWVPGTGGEGAVASNRFEKVETSARGRAIAGWGIGVLPGTGVASLEEMQSIGDNLRAERGEPRQRDTGRTRKSRPEMEEELRQVLEEFAQLSGISDTLLNDKVQKYTTDRFGKEIPAAETGRWDFAGLKDGEVALFINRIRAEVDKLRSEKAEL